MGLTKIFIDRARAEGIQQGVERERNRLRKAGVQIPPDNNPPNQPEEDRQPK